MEPNSFYVHVSIKDSDLRVKINFRDRAAKTRGFPEVLKMMVEFLVARSNAGRPVSLAEAKKMFEMDDADMEFVMPGGWKI